MHLEESAMQSIRWDSQNIEDLLPNWHKYYEHLENFLNNNIKISSSSFNNINQILADRSTEMDYSEDIKNKRKTAILSDWTNNPFERVNHSTNFEDYACSSDDTTLYSSDPIIKTDKNDNTSVSKQMSDTKKVESFSYSNNKTSSKFEPSVNPIVSNFIADQRDHSFVESCISAGNSSADVTPAGTPQSSPYTMRKVIDSNKTKIAKNEKNNTLSVNPKRWFYTGFFLNSDNAQHNVEHKPIINDKPITKNPSFKNLSVSNFDINAVGPTSW